VLRDEETVDLIVKGMLLLRQASAKRGFIHLFHSVGMDPLLNLTV